MSGALGTSPVFPVADQSAALGRISRPTGGAIGRFGYFLFCLWLTLFAEFIANDRPILVSYKGELLLPVFVDYPEEKFGGFFAVTDYRDPVIQDEIDANGWVLWPPIRYSFRTVNNEMPGAAPTKPFLMYPKDERCAALSARR